MSDLRNNLVPTNIQELFLPLSCVHSYGTRSSTSQNFYRKKIESWNKKKTLSRDLVPNYGMRYRPSCALQGGKKFCASFCASLIAGSRRAFSVCWLCLLLELSEMHEVRTFASCKAFYLTCLLFFRRLKITLDSEQPTLKEKRIIPSVWGGIKGFEHFLRGEYFSDCVSD